MQRACRITKFLLLSVLLLGTALRAYAADTGTGFVAESVFFSHTPLVEGSNVFIYASVLNTSPGAFNGKVVFTDSGAEIGSLAVTLVSGEARIVSISWTPTSGSHSISAMLQSVNGTPVASAGKLAPNAEVTAVAVPKLDEQPTTPDAAVVSSADIQKVIDSVAPPAVAQTLKPAFATIDQVRASAASVIENQIQETNKSLFKQTHTMSAGTTTAQTGTTTPVVKVKNGVLETSPSSGGSADTPASPKSFPDTVWYWALTAYVYLLSALRFGVVNPAAFYPVVILLFFWSMYKLYKSMTRPRFEQY